MIEVTSAAELDRIIHDWWARPLEIVQSSAGEQVEFRLGPGTARSFVLGEQLRPPPTLVYLLRVRGALAVDLDDPNGQSSLLQTIDSVTEGTSPDGTWFLEIEFGHGTGVRIWIGSGGQLWLKDTDSE